MRDSIYFTFFANFVRHRTRHKGIANSIAWISAKYLTEGGKVARKSGIYKTEKNKEQKATKETRTLCQLSSRQIFRIAANKTEGVK